MIRSYDVIVIGGGHAGCEAAHAAARFGAKTALITHRFDRIGEMSCNPAMGGLGKSHLMREVDALDGLIARCTDKAGIQFRVLNRSRGPAVRGPRAQCDRDLYRQAMQLEISSIGNLTVIEDEVTKLNISNLAVQGIETVVHGTLQCGSTIITTGTFLGGAIHIGNEVVAGGRWGDPASTTLSQQVRGLGFKVGRLKTGTPARLAGDTISWPELDKQEGDHIPEPLSYMTSFQPKNQVCCYVTHTTMESHQIIQGNLNQSSIYSGQIEGVGPRYCPSIEDKVVRFSNKPSHNIFLEPETRSGEVIYPNGISTSLPKNVQVDFIKSIPGLSEAKILRHGYAIEYDFIDPIEINSSLETKKIKGLYLAGQLIGTTGYEEAAALGLIAGLNAARAVSGDDPIYVSRSMGYIGVMIDDLITKGVTEPYRMFTSRAEFRLSLRVDNADERLTPLGAEWGIVGAERQAHFHKSLNRINELRSHLNNVLITPHQAGQLSIQINQDGVRRSLLDILGYPGVCFDDLCKIDQALANTPEQFRARLEADAIYKGFLERQNREIRILEQDEQFLLHSDINYSLIASLSQEEREKLAQIRPRDLSQARRIEGITASAITALMPYTTTVSERLG